MPWAQVELLTLFVHALLLPVGSVSRQASAVGGVRLLPPKDAPLRTQGRYIVSKAGERVKLGCVNWYGAHSEKHVVGGLEVRNISEIVSRTVELGFNCVRLPYSTQGHVQNPVIADEDVAKNPWFQGGLRFLDVFDRTVAAITAQGMMVIVNNHNHKSGWCCHYASDEGLWYTDEYSESTWIWSLVDMAQRYKDNPMVVGIDLRNEVHDYQDTVLTWGDGDPKTDWAAAATRAGNAVLAVNSKLLIVVMALCFGMDLRAARSHPVELSVTNRLVYESHSYLEFQVWQAISQNFVSWGSVRGATACGVLVLAAIVGLLLRAWWAVGRPKPRRGTLLVVAGAWWFALLLVAFAFSLALHSTCSKYCGYMASRDISPVYLATIGLAPLGLVVATLGCIKQYAVEAKASSFPIAGSPVSSLSPGTTVSSPGHQHACPRGLVSPPSVVGSPQDELCHPNHLAECAGEFSCRSTDSTAATMTWTGSLAGLLSPSARRWQSRSGLPPSASDGWRSCRVARARVLKRSGCASGSGVAIEREHVDWDRGLCCGFQCCLLCSVLVVVLTALHLFSVIAPSYWMMEAHFDRSWGFALEDGHNFTAPVWMGEFGNAKRGEYWVNMMRYLSDRDVDFAYWALNGKKWASGYVDPTTGDWHAYAEPEWEKEWYGILETDYNAVSRAWRLLDLQVLMQPSSAMWKSGVEPCDREVLGDECGG